MLLGILNLTVDLLQLGLVDDSLEVTYEVGVLEATSGIDSRADALEDVSCDGEIGESDALADEEGAGGDV